MENNEFNKNTEFGLEEAKHNDRRFPTVQKTGLFMLLLFILYFATSVLLGIILEKLDLKDEFRSNATLYYLCNMIYQLVYIGIPLLVMLLYYNKDRKQFLRLNPLQGMEILFTVLIGIVFFFANTYLTEVNYLLVTIFCDVEFPVMPEIISTSDKLVFLLELAVAAPIFEELIMRGVMQRGFEGKSKWFAIIITGVFFGMLHLSYYTIVPKILGGILLCYIVYITDSIYAGIIVHMLNNGISGLIELLIPVGDATEAAGDTAVTIDSLSITEKLGMSVFYLMLAAVFIVIIIVLLRAMRNSSKKAGEDGIYVYKENIREKLPREKRIRWYSYIPVVVSFVLMILYMVKDFIYHMK